jgi:hypothetical protein
MHQGRLQAVTVWGVSCHETTVVSTRSQVSQLNSGIMLLRMCMHVDIYTMLTSGNHNKSRSKGTPAGGAWGCLAALASRHSKTHRKGRGRNENAAAVWQTDLEISIIASTLCSTCAQTQPSCACNVNSRQAQPKGWGPLRLCLFIICICTSVDSHSHHSSCRSHNKTGTEEDRHAETTT